MIRSLFALGAVCAILTVTGVAGSTATIVDSWSSVAVPTPPPLQSVTVDPATTALLVLDFVKATCSGPRCTAQLPNVVKTLQAARASHTTVIYSYLLGGSIADTLAPVAPLGSEPTVQAGPDKFLGTDLAAILTGKGIKTVVVCGVTAQGAALYTGSHAALLGLKVIVPIDCTPAESAYAEQFTVWNLANAPRISPNVTLTTTDRLTY
jgi:nicotinamidase-related amidase